MDDRSIAHAVAAQGLRVIPDAAGTDKANVLLGQLDAAGDLVLELLDGDRGVHIDRKLQGCLAVRPQGLYCQAQAHVGSASVALENAGR